MASIAGEKTVECGSFVKRERQASPEAMDTNNNNNREGEDEKAPSGSNSFHLGPDGRSSCMRGQNQSQAQFASPGKQQQQQQQGGQQNGSSTEFPSRRMSAEILRSLISPEFPSQTGTPTSLSQLIPNLSSGFSLEGNEFPTPIGSAGCLTPQTADRMMRKRPLSISPLSSSSIDLNSLIRTSPISLVNYITSSRGSSAGSFGHLSPSLYSSVHQQQVAHGHMHSRPMQVSLRSGNYPVNMSAGPQPPPPLVAGHSSFGNHQQQQQQAEFASPEDVQIKKELETSPPSQHNVPGNLTGLHHQNDLLDRTDLLKMDDLRDSFFENAINVKMEPGVHDSAFLPPPLISMGQARGLETVHEEPTGILPSEEEELMHSDPTDYSVMLNDGGNECERYETKLGIIDNLGDADKQKKRIYYTYPTVEEPHNNQCRWTECNTQCEDLDHLVQHVNTDHIYRDSKKEFVCHWSGCVREKKPFKAQYMLLVHMRRHTGEKPHKCTYEGCFKAYSRLENLKTHLRSHTGERPYVCKYEGCGKAFSNASDCAKHMNRTHSDEKPYACPNIGCTKRYTDPSSRRKHMKNCQVNKKLRTDPSDPMSGADEESCAETASSAPSTNPPKPTTSGKNAKKIRRKSNPSTQPRLSGDTGYGSGSSQPGGYASGESQTGSQGGYTSYDNSDFSDQDEISRILQEQRLSDPTDMGAWTSSSGPMQQRGRGNPAHVQHSSGGYNFNMFQQSPLSPPHQYMRQAGAPPTTSGTSGIRQLLPGEMTAPNNAHHSGVDFRNSHNRSRPSSGYSSFRSSEKSPDDIEGSIRSNPMTTSLSTFSSNSSRVSSPCSNSDNRGMSLFPHAGAHNMLGHRDHMDTTTTGFPQKHSLRNSTYAHQQQARRHSDEMSNSSRGWTYSSQSSRYSELSDDILDGLPNGDERRNSFSKTTPLPLPESMQQNFSGSGGGMGIEYGEPGMGFRQPQQGGGNGFVSTSSTMPLRHFDNSDSFSGGSQHVHDGLFSQESAQLSGEAYINMMQHLSSPGSSLVSPGSNMVLGTMDTFSQALSEETQYYETMYSQVK